MLRVRAGWVTLSWRAAACTLPQPAMVTISRKWLSFTVVELAERLAPLYYSHRAPAADAIHGQKPVSRKSTAARIACLSSTNVPATGPRSERVTPASCEVISRYRSPLNEISGAR